MHPFLLELVALVGGTVHTMEPGADAALATVLVRDGIVQAVLAPDVTLPREARRVDVTGAHVVPGLIDALVYFDPAHDALYVAQGVTTIRDLGGEPVRALLAREPEQRDFVPGPFLLTAAAVIDGDPPSSSEAVILRTPEMADELLPILFGDGVDLISVQPGLEADVLRRVITLAHEQELEVWGPLPRSLSLQDALAAGLDGVLFEDSLLPREVTWEKVQPGGLEAGSKALIEAGAGLVPVLRATALRVDDPGPEDLPLDLLDPMYEAQWRAEREFRASLADPAYVATGERVVAKQLALLAKLVADGAHVVPGSAAPQPWLFPGVALHEELALWERAGIAPIDVLARATRVAAQELGIGAERGTIAPGKVADLVVVRDDPREGVAALRDPSIVVVRGHVLERPMLDDRLATVRRRIADLRAELAKPIEVAPPDVPEGAVVLRGKVEVSSIGQVIRAESYAVVREPDGALAYCGRTVYRGAKGEVPRETHVLQRVRDGKLDEFLVELSSSEHVLTSHGLWTADQLRIERKVDGKPVDLKRVRERVACVDVGSVTSLLVLASLVREEPFQIVTYHEMLEPELALWGMAWGGEERLVHVVRTHKGTLQFQSTPKGSIDAARAYVGGGTIDTVLVAEDALGGPGMPPPAEKLRVLTGKKDAAGEAGDASDAGERGDAGEKENAREDGAGEDGAGDAPPSPPEDGAAPRAGDR